MRPLLAKALPALALLLGTTGCLVIPVPHSDSGYARTNVSQLAQERFLPSVTTREEVILELGEPDAASMDEHYLAYRSEKVVAWWIFGVGAQGGGGMVTGGNINRNHFYVFEFDPQGRYQTALATGQWSIAAGAEEPALNPAVFSFHDPNGVTGSGSMGAYWLKGMDGFRGLPAQFALGVPGELVLTESNLVFTVAAHGSDEAPALSLPLNSVARVYLDKSLFLCRLVIHTDAGSVHSFQIAKPSGLGGTWQDKPAMQAACDFIESKIKQSHPGR